MPLHIKICGITNTPDALAALSAGADALGLVFAPSPRRVSLEEAEAIRAWLPAHVNLCGVFVKEPFALVHDAILSAGLSAVQFHHSPEEIWTADELSRWHELLLSRRIRIVRAFRAKDAETLRTDLADLPAGVNQILLDAFVPGTEGGTGKKFDWVLVKTAKQYGKPVIVAGGLTPENIADAVRITQPWGVDVSSGVESSPGRKDADAMRRFVANAR
jgi:phosphoribosylanthranilate isomerase